MPGYRHFLAIQTVLPDAYREDRAFIGTLTALRQAGFDGVELNIRDPRVEDPHRLAAFLSDFGLSLSMVATGLAARCEGLSLATKDEFRRRESVQWTRETLFFASTIGAGVIAGFLKGAMSEKTAAHREQLRTSVAELALEALRLKTPFLVEAINRFESPLGNSLGDVLELIGRSANPFIQILPDTWHMGIEESHIEASLVRFKDHYSSVHLSDNNRFFPGFGGLDFGKIIGVLDALGYQGKLAIEGNVKGSFVDEAIKSADYLRPFLQAD
jgi:sugar phosphate isomerase/epimerase